jgi:flagellar protein FliL
MGEEKGKKKKGLNPLILVIIVLVLAVVGMAAYFLVFKQTSTPGPYVPAEVVEAKWATDEFLVNLADKDVDRYLKTTVVLGYDSTDTVLATELTDQEDVIRDAVIRVLMTKKKTELDNAGIDKLKVELIKKVNAVLGGNKIISVYFNQFVIQ